MKQNPLSLIVVEKENCMFQCNYTVNPFISLRWYEQDTGRGPISLIIMTYSETKKSNGRYSVTLETITKHSSLYIIATQLRDSVLYICVVGALCSPGTFSQ